MPDLQFQVEEVAPITHAASPTLAFKLRISNAVANEAIHSIGLRCQVQIEPTRRHYGAQEREQLAELFGESERWSQTLRPILWANVSLNLAGFQESTVIDLPVPCSFDFNVAVTKYIHGLEEGDLPVSLLFSGTIFHAGRSGLQVAQIPWDREVRYRVPLRVWREMMDAYYPNTAWLCLRRDVFERLYQYKSRHGIPTWEQAVERVLAAAAEVRP